MLEFKDKDNINKNQIETVQKKKHEYKLFGTFLRKKGLRLFGYNSLDDELYEITVKHKDIAHASLKNGIVQIESKNEEEAVIDTRHEIFQALNLKSARKRLRKFKNGEIKELSNLKPKGKIEF